jgi:hypothetical protein
VIPPLHGWQTTKPSLGRYRRLLQTRFDKQTYGQRWQVETVMSMLKRRQGEATSGCTYPQSPPRHDAQRHHPQYHDRVTVNGVFYRADLTPILTLPDSLNLRLDGE